VPPGRLVDPQLTTFFLNWDDEREDGYIEDTRLLGAEAAIAWARQRSDRIAIRLAHTDESYFYAGSIPIENERDGVRVSYPPWPPAGPPVGGWWTPADDEAAAIESYRRATTRNDAKLGLERPSVRRTRDEGS
jgi:hypothetical protein